MKNAGKIGHSFAPELFRIGQGNAEIDLSQLSELAQQAKDRESS